jgi:Tol biopolymer transport system component
MEFARNSKHTLSVLKILVAGIVLLFTVLLCASNTLAIEKIIYVSDEGGNDNIWTMNPDGSDKTQITIEGNNKRPMLSPDGTQIAFSSDRDGTIELWKMGSEGSNPVQLTTNMNGIMGISWSPGGDRICFSTNSKLYIINSDGSGLNEIYSPSGVFGSGVSWVPVAGSEWIVFPRQTETSWSPTRELYKIKSDGTGLVQLTDNSVADSTPAVSPNGEKILFSRSHGSSGYGISEFM